MICLKYPELGYFKVYHCGIIMSKGDGMRLRELRKKRGISRLKLADYFDVSIDYLLERTDNPHLQK